MYNRAPKKKKGKNSLGILCELKGKHIVGGSQISLQKSKHTLKVGIRRQVWCVNKNSQKMEKASPLPCDLKLADWPCSIVDVPGRDKCALSSSAFTDVSAPIHQCHSFKRGNLELGCRLKVLLPSTYSYACPYD